MATKSLFASRSFWFNLLTGLTLFFALPQLTAVLPEGAIPYVLLAQAAINIVLRLVTSEAVSMTGTGRGTS